MADVDVHAPQRTSKIQLEEQQRTQRADFRDAGWREIEYPGRSKWRSFYNASIFELAGAAILSIFGIILVLRLFFVADSNKTQADKVGFFIFFSIIAAVGISGSLYLLSRVIKSFRENKIFLLPNGYPVNITTILKDYETMNDRVFDKLGYYDVHHTRAGVPIVAPGEITSTYSPSNTYAPSNMPKEQSENQMSESMLQSLLGIKTTDGEKEEGTELPTFVNFFDHIDAREPGHVLVGIDEHNTMIQMPIMKMFNHLVGGSVGTGKSVYLRSLVYQLMLEADESDIPIKLGLADIENNTFPEFRSCRHVDWYASNYVEIEHMTSALLREVERRKMMYEALSSTPKDIERYNVLARREGVEELPIVVVLYDEFSALMHRSQVQQKRILADILQLALRSRKYGIFLIIAGQTFKADLIDSAVLGQFNFNVAFRVRSSNASISVLGQPGAEKLKHPGEALIRAKDGTVQHVQSFFLDDDDLLEALKPFNDPDSDRAIPSIVQEIIDYSHTHMGDKVKFRELEVHMADRGLSRGELMDHLQWMDDHKFTVRGDKNARILNWKVINRE